MINFLHIVCYKWGTRYTHDDVKILRAMVKRNLSVQHCFHCVTDDPTGFESDIIVHDLPPNLPGNGPKMYNFSKDFLGLKASDYIVSLDLDIVIVDSLDFLAHHPEHNFVAARHRVRAGRHRIHGAAYRLKVGSLTKVWDNFIADPDKAAGKFPGTKGNTFSEQYWLEDQLTTDEKNFFPKEKIILFRQDCHAASAPKFVHNIFRMLGHPYFMAQWGKARLPEIGEAIVSFAGGVKPKNVMQSHYKRLRHAPFVRDYWYD